MQHDPKTRTAGPQPRLQPGEVAARLDRLPLRWVQWHLALTTAAAWGLVIMSDGLMNKLYPFLWAHAFSPFVYSVLNAIQIGVGILIGEYLGGYLSDRFGRRFVLVLSAVDAGVFMFCLAFTSNPVLLGLLLFLQALGMGGVLSTHAVYLHEVVPPRLRGRIAQGAQSLNYVIFFLAAWPFFFWVPGTSPGDYRYAIYVMAGGPLVVLLPILFTVPESPRWLEGKGRMADAGRALARIERRASKNGAIPLPPPRLAAYEVEPIKKVPLHEIFRGEYGRRTALLLICWILGYSGIIYGILAFETLVLVHYRFSSQFVFLWIGLAFLIGGGGGFWLNSAFNERIERRSFIGIASIVFLIGAALFYVFTGFVYRNAVGTTIGMIVMTFGSATWLFQMYNYTANAFPTRLRSVGTGWTDGVGHLGAIFGSLIVIALYTATASIGFLGAYLYVTIPGALIPAFLVWLYGIKQREAVLEVISR